MSGCELRDVKRTIKRKNRIGKHFNTGSELNYLIDMAHKNPLINKIILGRAKNVRHSKSPGCIEFREFVEAGIKFKAYTRNGIRDIFTYCDKEVRDLVKESILSKCN